MVLVFQKERKRLLMMVPLVVLVVTFWLFDKWRVGNLKEASAYVSTTSIMNKDMVAIFFRNLTMRYTHTVLFIGLFFFPFLIATTISFVKKIKIRDLIFIAPLFALFTWWLRTWFFSFPVGNVFYDCGIGPPLLLDTFILDQNHSHSASGLFAMIINVFGLLGALLLNFCIPAGIIQLVGRFRKKEPVNFVILFLFCFAVIYLLMLSYTDSFFDRYILPPLFAAAILISKADLQNKLFKGFVLIYMSVTVLFSTLATKDYFTWNQTRYDLIAETVKTGVDPLNINGGIEYIAYKYYASPWWGFWTGDITTYYITCGKLRNYSKAGAKAYHRLVPFKMDTIYLYKRWY